MTAQQMPLPPRPTVSNRLVTVAVALIIAVISLWILIADSLQASRSGDASVPSILPEGPAVVELQAPGSEIIEAAEPIPLPGLAR